MRRVLHPRGFTLVELLTVIGVGATGAVMASVASQPGKPPAKSDDAGDPAAMAAARASELQLKDAVQIRGITQALIVWSTNNADAFPLPSAFDGSNATVSLNGRAKDTTANIVSLLAFNGSISPELCVSPAEVNPSIKVDDRYEFVNPKASMKPADALWDPGFKADFTKGQTGNVSYAHLQPSDGRLPRWASTFSAVEPLVSNRAPELEAAKREGDEASGWTYSVKAAAKDSLTYKIHGATDSWEGNVSYADGHVEFNTRLAPNGKAKPGERLTYSTRDDKQFFDCFFVDEDDDKAGSNAYLGIFTSAGKSAKDFRGIWD